jgi:capsule polysaccharide export protein KpsC/LpsZ
MCVYCVQQGKYQQLVQQHWRVVHHAILGSIQEVAKFVRIVQQEHTLIVLWEQKQSVKNVEQGHIRQGMEVHV